MLVKCTVILVALAAGLPAHAQEPGPDHTARVKALAPAAATDPEVRRQMLEIWTAAPPDERQALFVTIANEDAHFAALLTAVGENPAPAAIAALSESLAEFAPQFPADMSLRQLFIATIQHGGPAVHQAVAAALKRSPAAAMTTPLIAIYGASAEDRPTAIGKVAEAARRSDKPSLDVLVLAAHDQDPDTARAATEWLAALAGTNQGALEEIRRLASDPQPSFRRAAVAALGIGPARRPELLDILLGAALDADASVRLAAVIALSPNALRRNEQATATLMKATSDADPKVRRTAVEALGASLTGGNDKARAFLSKLASSSNPEVATAARKALATQPLRKK